MLRRLLLVSVGFVVAAGAGMIFLPLAALTDATIRDAGLTAVFAALLDAADGYDPEDALAAIGFVLWAMGVAVCAAPLAIVALIGEAAGARALAWYSGGSAILAAAAPWILRAARGSARAGEMNAAEGRLALLFFLTGALTGAIYWLIAGRGAPSRTS